MCWDINFPEEWMCSLTGMAPKSGGCYVLVQVQADRWFFCDGQILGYVCLKSLSPLRYESVQTAFVPRTYADAGLF